MDLISVRSATVLFFVQLERTNPLRKAKDREITARLVERYGFLKFPVTYQDHNDTDNGVQFADGSFEGTEVVELKIFTNGFLITTGESTEVAERFFDDMAGVWRDVGLSLTPEMVLSKTFISQLVVKSEVDLLALNTALDAVIENWFPNRSAGLSSIGIQTVGNVDTPAAVRLERLVGVPLSEMQFYAQAPLPTTWHMSFLTRWETVLKQTQTDVNAADSARDS